MATVIIFWTAIMAGVFFLLGVVLNGLVAAFTALFSSSTGKILVCGGVAGVVALILYLLYGIVQAIIAGEFWSIVGSLVIIGFLVGGLVVAALGVGAAILEIAAMVAGSVLYVAWLLLKKLAEMCNGVYGKCLQIIDKQLKKC